MLQAMPIESTALVICLAYFTVWLVVAQIAWTRRSQPSHGSDGA
jgi:hypothetical protein